MDAPLQLPLFALFNRLRAAELPLGIAEYRLLIDALRGGFGLQDRESLRRLCRALWTKSQEEGLALDFLFAQVFQEPLPGSAGQTGEPPRPEPPTEGAGSGPDHAEPDPITAAEPPPVPPPAAPLPLPLRTPAVDSALPPVLHPAAGQVRRWQLQTGDYRPATPRQMRQGLRRLRVLRREGRAEELDLEATVNAAQRLGVLGEAVLRPPRRNQAELVLLLDREGSMAPFHSLCDRLVEAARRGARLRRLDLFTFHDLPESVLVPLAERRGDGAPARGRDAVPVPIDELFGEWAVRRPAVVVLSDAGAARGRFDLDRIEATVGFLEHLRTYVRRVVWLNPLPRKRWARTSADEIRRWVDMLELSRRGLERSIAVLRGRPLASFPDEGEP